MFLHHENLGVLLLYFFCLHLFDSHVLQASATPSLNRFIVLQVLIETLLVLNHFYQLIGERDAHVVGFVPLHRVDHLIFGQLLHDII